MSNANQSNSNQNSAHLQNGKERIDAADASINILPGGFQAIATAYGDYTKKSFEDTKSFVEKLSSVTSLEKAIEIQLNSRRPLTKHSLRNRRRLARCTAISPSNPTSHSRASLPR